MKLLKKNNGETVAFSTKSTDVINRYWNIIENSGTTGSTNSEICGGIYNCNSIIGSGARDEINLIDYNQNNSVFIRTYYFFNPNRGSNSIQQFNFNVFDDSNNQIFNWGVGGFSSGVNKSCGTLPGEAGLTASEWRIYVK